MKRIAHKILLWLNYFLSLALILTYLSVHISPERFALLSFFGLIYPFLLFANVFFLIYRIYRRQKYFLIPLFSIIIGFNHFTDFFIFNIKKENPPQSSIRVLSYNVRMFDLYDWNKGVGTGQKILKLIKQKNLDIICLQEFYSNSDSLNYQDSIIAIQNTKSYLISYKNQYNYSGNALFCRFPSINKGSVNIGDSNQKCLFADIVRDLDTIRIYSIHLASLHLSKKDYEFIDNMENNDKNKNMKSVKGIGGKMLEAYKKRAKESNIISAHIKSSPYKVIVCGDFNDVPISYSYRTIKGNLKDAFKESGFGLGITYIKRFFSFRIDYILHSPEFRSYNFNRTEKKLSDHYPIFCEIAN